jgi:uncharacterized protein YmfQ (DUF2313 family)
MLSNYAPSFLASGDIFKKIYENQQAEIDSLNLDIKDLINQLFVNTATWGLSIWEEEFNIKINTFDSYEIRRSRIIAKKKGQGTFTKAFVKNLAESFENGIVEVIEHNEDYYFTIKFTGTKGIPPNLQDLKDVINELKPAHLGVEYEFTFTTWGEVKTITWGTVKTGTWGELRTREVI